MPFIEVHPRKKAPLDPRKEFVELTHRYRYWMIGGAVAVILLAALWGGNRYYQERLEQKAAEFYAALPLEGEPRRLALEELAEEYPKQGAGVLARFQLGRDDSTAKKWVAAEAWFQPLPRFPERLALFRILVQHNLAILYESQGQWQKALDLYRQSAVDPNNKSRAYTYYDMGRVSEALGRPDEARKWYERAVEEGAGLSLADRATDRQLWLDIASQ